MGLIHLAFDESNHGRNPEVVVGVFSDIESDSTPIEIHGKKRLTEEEVVEFFSEQNRSWISYAIPRDQIRKYTRAIIQAAPHIIKLYAENRYEEMELNISFDGAVNGLPQKISPISKIPRVSIVGARCFPKAQDSSAHYTYSSLLRVADAVALSVYKTYYFGKKLSEPELKKGGTQLRWKR